MAAFAFVPEDDTNTIIAKATSAINHYASLSRTDSERSSTARSISMLLKEIENRSTEDTTLKRSTTANFKKALEEKLMVEGNPLDFLDKQRDLGQKAYEKWGKKDFGHLEEDAVVKVEDDQDDQEEEQHDVTETDDGSTTNTPPDNHPVWGKKGIMYGLKLNVTEKNNRSIVTRSDFPQRNANVFGDNGVAVGEWWPYQINTKIHGAHGLIQGAIYGKPSEGTYSIIVTGQHAVDDPDNGEVLKYGDHRAKPDDCLKTAHKLNRDIRVIRSAGHGGDEHHGPAVGYRYDGLYNIVEEPKKKPDNDDADGYWQYTLKRKSGQAKTLDECRLRPTEAEKKLWNRVVKDREAYPGAPRPASED